MIRFYLVVLDKQVGVIHNLESPSPEKCGIKFVSILVPIIPPFNISPPKYKRELLRCI
jgi:hypothetical protein